MGRLYHCDAGTPKASNVTAAPPSEPQSSEKFNPTVVAWAAGEPIKRAIPAPKGATAIPVQGNFIMGNINSGIDDGRTWNPRSVQSRTPQPNLSAYMNLTQWDPSSFSHTRHEWDARDTPESRGRSTPAIPYSFRSSHALGSGIPPASAVGWVAWKPKSTSTRIGCDCN